VANQTELCNWLESDSLLAVHDFAQSTNHPQNTRDLVEAAFNKVTKQKQLKPGQILPPCLCIVFEEAHSLIPEWTQASRAEQDAVSMTARIILQGRKYGVGSLIITQRTANVTKTILNQCNTIIALRSFDQTGLEFLKNYMGADCAEAIGTLPNRDAILVGKASSCLMPVIFTISDFSGKWTADDGLSASSLSK
jgi:hypothetical protein